MRLTKVAEAAAIALAAALFSAAGRRRGQGPGEFSVPDGFRFIEVKQFRLVR